MKDDTATATSDQADRPTDQGKGRGRSKAKPKPTDQAKGKRSLNLSLPHEDYQRLALHALDQDKTISDLVCELARTYLRSVHLTRTATRPTTDTRE